LKKKSVVSVIVPLILTTGIFFVLVVVDYLTLKIENRMLKQEAFLMRENFKREKIPMSVDPIGYRIYHFANQGLKSLDPQARRIIFFGDSITSGWNLKKHFSDISFQVINRGIRGQFTSQMVARFYQDVVRLKPEAVVILGGTNDSVILRRPRFFKCSKDDLVTIVQDNLRVMVQIAHKAGISRVFLCTIPPVVWDEDTVRHKEAPKVANVLLAGYVGRNSINTRVSRWIRKFCKEGNCTLIDYQKEFSCLGDHLKYFQDTVHPNDKGYGVMTRVVKASTEWWDGPR